MALTSPRPNQPSRTLGQSALTKRLIEDGLEGASGDWQATALWRRGMMHAIERLDAVLAQKGGPTSKLEAVRRALDELTELQRAHMPTSYREAFAICSADLAAQRERAA